MDARYHYYFYIIAMNFSGNALTQEYFITHRIYSQLTSLSNLQ